MRSGSGVDLMKLPSGMRKDQLCCRRVSTEPAAMFGWCAVEPPYMKSWVFGTQKPIVRQFPTKSPSSPSTATCADPETRKLKKPKVDGGLSLWRTPTKTMPIPFLNPTMESCN